MGIKGGYKQVGVLTLTPSPYRKQKGTGLLHRYKLSAQQQKCLAVIPY